MHSQQSYLESGMPDSLIQFHPHSRLQFGMLAIRLPNFQINFVLIQVKFPHEELTQLSQKTNSKAQSEKPSRETNSQDQLEKH